MIVGETTTSGGKQLCAKDTGAITASDLSGGSFIISQLCGIDGDAAATTFFFYITGVKDVFYQCGMGVNAVVMVDDAKNAVEQTEDSTFGGTADEFEYGKFNNFAF